MPNWCRRIGSRLFFFEVRDHSNIFDGPFGADFCWIHGKFLIVPNAETGYYIFDEQENLLMLSHSRFVDWIPYLTGALHKSECGTRYIRRTFWIHTIGTVRFDSASIVNMTTRKMNYLVDQAVEKRQNLEIMK